MNWRDGEEPKNSAAIFPAFKPLDQSAALNNALHIGNKLPVKLQICSQTYRF